MSFYSVSREPSGSTVINPGEVAEAELMLRVHSKIPESFKEFSFNIYMTATEYVMEQAQS